MANGPYLGVALDGAGAHPAAWRCPRRRRAGCSPPSGWSARPDRRARPGSTSSPSTTAFDPPAPGSATLPGRFDALLALARGRAGDDVDRARADDHDDAHRAVPRLQERRHARPRVRRTGRLARRRCRPPPRPRARVRPHRRPTRRRAVGRGRRRDRGRQPAVGQLGGRRRHPRPGHGPLRRPRQAPLHRLRGRVLQRPRPVDHAALTAGPATRGRSTPADDHATAVAARRADIVLIDAADADTARRRRRRHPSPGRRGRPGSRRRRRARRRPGR